MNPCSYRINSTFAPVRFLLYFTVCLLLLVSPAPAQQRVCIDSIIFEGNHRTQASFMERELNFSQGQCLPADSLPHLLKIAEQRLFNTQLFNQATADTFTTEGRYVVRFTVKERFPIFPKPNLEFADRNFNVWWTEQHRKLNRLNVGLTLLHNNVNGRRDILSVGAQIGYTKKFLLSYERPFIDARKQHGLGASVQYLQNLEVSYITDSNKLHFARFETQPALQLAEAAVWYTYRPQFATRHILKTTIQQYSIHDSIASLLNPDYLGNSRKSATVLNLEYRLEHNKVDNWNYPLKGSRFIGIAAYQQVLKGAGMPSLHLQYDYYHSPFPKWYISSINRGRIAFNREVPYIFQRNMGYDYDVMRGYEYFVMDGSLFALTRANIKRTLIDRNIKLPIKYFQVVPIRVYAKVFADAGYTYRKDIGSQYLNNKFLYSYGIGLDIVTLYDIKIRLEYTFNREGLKDLYIHKSGE
ncbi:Outer membrane protein assembly factor BamA [compost metagenome]